MVSQIGKALAFGYSSRTILNQIAKKNPQYADRILTAVTLGYTASSILKRLTNKTSSADNAEDFMTEHEKTQKRDKYQKRKALTSVVGTLGSIGALAAGAYGLANRSGLEPKDLPVESPNIPMAPTPTPTLPQTPSPIRNQLPSIQSQTSKISPLKPSSPIRDPKASVDLVRNLKAEDTVLNMMNQGFDTTTTASAIKKLLPKDKANALDQIEGGVERVVDDYKTFLSKDKSILANAKAIKGLDKSIPSPKFEKNSMMIGPDGLVGRLKSFNKSHSLLDVNGKTMQFKKNQLQPIPREWEKINLDLSSIPEEDRSSNINLFAPSKDKKHAFVRFWSESNPVIYMYTRKDGRSIDDETLESIANEMDAPISSGNEFFGAWSTTGKSRGSALHHKLKILAQSEEEEDDPEKPFVFTKIPITFEHGFTKAINSELFKNKKAFNAFHKQKK